MAYATEYNGEWFVPSNRAIRLPGILKISDDGIELKLFSLTDFVGNSVVEDRDKTIHTYRIILGECRGSRLTVVNSDLRESNRISEKLDFFSVSPSLVLDGAHFSAIDNIKLKNLHCSYSFLTEWMDGQEFYDLLDIETASFRVLEKKYNKKISIEVNDQVSIDIVRSVMMDDSPERNSLGISVVHFANFHAKEGLPWSNLELLAYGFKKLISFAVNESVDLEMEYAQSVNSDDPGIRIYTKKGRGSDDKDANDYRAASFMLFNARGLGDERFNSIVKTWFHSLKRYEVIYDMYLDTQQWFAGTGIYLSSVVFNNRFLNIIQSLEFFHTMQHESEDEDKATFKTRLDTIAAKLNAEDKKWLKKRTHKFSKSLQLRIFDLVEEFSFLFQGILDDRSAKLQFAGHVQEIRNAISHGRHTKTDNIEGYRDYYFLSRTLLIACILSLLGFSKTEVETVFNDAYPYSQRLRVLKEKKG